MCRPQPPTSYTSSAVVGDNDITRAELGHSVDTRSPGISGISQKDDTAQRRRIGEEVVRLGSLQTVEIVKTEKIFREKAGPGLAAAGGWGPTWL